MAAPTLHQSKHGSGRGPAPGGGLHLTVMGPSLFETHPLPASGALSIGRDDEADVRIVDRLASRIHARIHVDPSGKITVEDLGSSNGTFVRGEQIESGKPVALLPGEAVNIGFTHLMVQRRLPRLSV